MTRGPRVVVGGLLGLLPAGGVTWDYVQYPAGFAALGCDVYYVEDTRLWPVYQSAGGADCTANIEHLRAVMGDFGLDGRWAYRDEASGRCFGLGLERLQEVCRTADVFVNVSCATVMREEYRRIPVRMLVDTDPMFTQIQYRTQRTFTVGESGLRGLVDAHTHFFTFGENVGAADCRMPDCGVDWIPTRQPITLTRWPASDAPPSGEAAYTTVMNWSAAPPLDYEGEEWGQKNVEFSRILSLPAALPGIPLAVAVGQTTGAPFPADTAMRHGWRVLDPAECAGNWRSYRDFIEASRGEFSVAKQTYVKARTGWFSCRSACYLAAGRAVVTQDTGWSDHLPVGRGLLAFDDGEGAREALLRVEADPRAHARAARAVAEEHFRSDIVLGAMLRAAGG